MNSMLRRLVVGVRPSGNVSLVRFFSPAAVTSRRVFRPLTPELVEAVVACVAETMSQPEEPLTHALKLKRHHWHSLIIPFVERAAHAANPLSIVAVNPSTGRVDGCMLTEDWLAPRPLAYRININDEWSPVRAAFRELHLRYEAAEGPPRAGELLRVLYFSCVSARTRACARSAPPLLQAPSYTPSFHPLPTLRCTLARGVRASCAVCGAPQSTWRATTRTRLSPRRPPRRPRAMHLLTRWVSARWPR